MLVSILLIISTLTTGTSIPNYYPGFVAARDASKKTQKEMIVFFTEANNDRCTSAWDGFAADAKGTSRYISTQMDIGDFDGHVYFELLGFENIPAWVILYPDGTVKESWEGGWKDAQGNILPTPASPPTTTNPSSQKTNTPPSYNPTPSVPKPVEKPVEVVQGNYFIQAGYFGSEANAVKLINDLHAKGFDSYTAKSEAKDGKTFYRVVSSLFENEQEATSEQRSLLAVGISAAVKKL